MSHAVLDGSSFAVLINTLAEHYRTIASRNAADGPDALEAERCPAAGKGMHSESGHYKSMPRRDLTLQNLDDVHAAGCMAASSGQEAGLQQEAELSVGSKEKTLKSRKSSRFIFERQLLFARPEQSRNSSNAGALADGAGKDPGSHVPCAGHADHHVGRPHASTGTDSDLECRQTAAFSDLPVSTDSRICSPAATAAGNLEPLTAAAAARTPKVDADQSFCTAQSVLDSIGMGLQAVPASSPSLVQVNCRACTLFGSQQSVS